MNINKFIIINILMFFVSCSNHPIKSNNNGCSEYKFSKGNKILFKDTAVDEVMFRHKRNVLGFSLNISEALPSEIFKIYLWPSIGIDGYDCGITEKTNFKFCNFDIEKQNFYVSVYMDEYIQDKDLDLIKAYINKNICE
ncbi:MAG: hypothetical protein HRU38_23945 [Saccharospirillaceae bacterium]|nr:hypothetical protein [Pseudomonadales bacterium]NRB81675.1 hypothetical protein [Saccharospirillaceae bacterium]